jgi:hypothetical protein
MVLGTIDTQTPGTDPRKGNAWGIIPATEEQKQIARNFLADQMASGSMTVTARPVSVTPVAAAPATASTPHQGENPFA